MNKVSIIIPAYNLQDCIEYSVRSAINQTYSNTEIIIVDDGSTDATLLKCREIAKEHNNIKIIHQDNKGVSAARNTGINNATGDYIMFLDGDDIIAPLLVEILLNDCITDERLIFAGASYEKIYSYHYSFEDNNIGKAQMIDRDNLLGELLSGRYKSISVGCKLFRRESINNIRFAEGKIENEDKFFLFECMMSSEGVFCIRDDILYGYFQRSNSTCHSGYSKGMLSVVEFSDEMIDRIRLEKPSLLVNAEYNDLVTRLSVLKQIVRTKVYSQERDTFNTIKKEIIDRYGRKTRSFFRRYYLEYLVLRINNVLYCLCVKLRDIWNN